MGSIASQITSLVIVYPTVYSDTDQSKHQSSASLAFVRGIHRRPVNSPHKWPVTRKMFPFDDVIMLCGHVTHGHQHQSTSENATFINPRKSRFCQPSKDPILERKSPKVKMINALVLEGHGYNLRSAIFKLISRIYIYIYWTFPVKLPLGECH